MAVAVLCCLLHGTKNNTFPLKTSFPSCQVVLEFTGAKVMGDSVVAVKVFHLLYDCSTTWMSAGCSGWAVGMNLLPAQPEQDSRCFDPSPAAINNCICLHFTGMA